MQPDFFFPVMHRLVLKILLITSRAEIYRTILKRRVSYQELMEPYLFSNILILDDFVLFGPLLSYRQNLESTGFSRAIFPHSFSWDSEVVVFYP